MISLNPRVHEAINDGLLYFADPRNGIAGQLLDGTNKCLVIHSQPKLTQRQFELLRPGDPGFDVPNFIWTALQKGELNIRAGVPLWVMGWHKQEKCVLGAGVYHPLTTSATLHLLAKGKPFDTVYFSDPRLTELAASELVDEDNVRNARLKGLIKIEPMHGHEYQTFADIKASDIPNKLWNASLKPSDLLRKKNK